MGQKPPTMNVKGPGDDFLNKIKTLQKDKCDICGKQLGKGESSYILTVAGVSKTACKACYFKKAKPTKDENQ